MELVDRKWLQLYAGRCHRALAEKVGAHLGVELGDANLIDFANGEIGCRFGTSVRGADTFILQTHGRPVNHAIMEQLIMIDAAKRASARRITAVCPYYGYARQDRKAEGREPIAAKLVADLFTAAGAGRIISVDLHAGQIQGFFDGPVDHLTAMPVFVRYLRGRVGDGLVVVAPDAGRVRVAERFAEHLKADLAFVHKRHRKGVASVVEARAVVGEVEGRTCVVVDDMIDTAGTICAAAEILKATGAAEVLVVPPTACCRVLRSTTSSARRSAPSPSPTRCPCRTATPAASSPCCQWPPSSPPRSAPSSRTARCRRSSAARTSHEPGGHLPEPPRRPGRLPFGMPVVLDDGVRAGEEQADVAVGLPVDLIGRGAVRSLHREDLAVTIRLAQVQPLDDDAVTNAGLHSSSPGRSSCLRYWGRQ
jgi:ribose-phosphate pyrophosphokinase